MGRINFRIDDSLEKELRRKCKEQGYNNFSDYLRERITSEQEQEQPLSRVSIESQIDELKRSIDRLNSNMIILSKKTLRESHMNSNLVLGFFNAVIEDDETKQTIYNRAVEDTEEFLSKNFK